MKVFSKKKYFENEWNCTLYCRDIRTRAWVDECDGKPVINNRCKEQKILDVWTEDVDNPVEETGRILNKFLPNGFPKPEPKPCPIPEYQIIITCWGDTTHADMFVNGHKVKETKAKRNPADKFNFRIGAQTAFNRLWEKKKMPVVREVKRPAKPGEWVKVVNAYGSCWETYKTGDVLKVERPFKTDEEGWVYLEGHRECACSPSEYVVLEGYKPE